MNYGCSYLKYVIFPKSTVLFTSNRCQFWAVSLKRKIYEKITFFMKNFSSGHFTFLRKNDKMCSTSWVSCERKTKWFFDKVMFSKYILCTFSYFGNIKFAIRVLQEPYAFDRMKWGNKYVVYGRSSKLHYWKLYVNSDESMFKVRKTGQTWCAYSLFVQFSKKENTFQLIM